MNPHRGQNWNNEANVGTPSGKGLRYTHVYQVRGEFNILLFSRYKDSRTERLWATRMLKLLGNLRWQCWLPHTKKTRMKIDGWIMNHHHSTSSANRSWYHLATPTETVQHGSGRDSHLHQHETARLSSHTCQFKMLRYNYNDVETSSRPVQAVESCAQVLSRVTFWKFWFCRVTYVPNLSRKCRMQLVGAADPGWSLLQHVSQVAPCVQHLYVAVPYTTAASSKFPLAPFRRNYVRWQDR